MANAIKLLEALEDLDNRELKTFKWYLQQADFLKDFPVIPKSRLETADRPDTVDLMVQTYRQQCVEVARKVLKRMKRNDLVESLSESESEAEGQSAGAAPGAVEISDVGETSENKEASCVEPQTALLPDLTPVSRHTEGSAAALPPHHDEPSLLQTEERVEISDVGETSENKEASCVEPQTALLPDLTPVSRHTEAEELCSCNSCCEEPKTCCSTFEEQRVMMPVPEPPPSDTSLHLKLQSELQDRFKAWAERQHSVNVELFIADGRNGNANVTSGEPMKPSDIFKHLCRQGTHVRTVLTNGITGFGKSFLVQMFVSDWAEKRENQDLHLVFPFAVRQLNFWRTERFSLAELIHTCIPETNSIKEETLNDIFTTLQSSRNVDHSEIKLLFIFDGLDESHLQLDFATKANPCLDVTESTTVQVLLTNLIRGKLLPSAHLWITTQPAAANQIPPWYVGMVTEVRGFTDPQKEEYFRKRFRDEEQARTIISHIKTSRSLHIMCHIPVFCWITATVLEDMLKSREGGELPKTLTEMYIHFLLLQINQAKQTCSLDKCIQYLQSLAKLAFQQLLKNNKIFDEEDLQNSGLHLRAASEYSTVFTHIFRQLSCQRKFNIQRKMFCFNHLNIHEFLAAVHVNISLTNYNKNVMSVSQVQSLQMCFRKTSTTKVHKHAVKKALKSPNGHLDLFLRFLLSLSLQTNQTLLRGLLTQTGSSSQTNQKTVEYIKKKLSENVSAERSINLFHCLNELNDRSLVEEIQQFLRSGSLSADELSPAQWSALVFILLSSEKDLDVFDLKKYSASEEALLRLLPVVKASNKALLSGCHLSERSCAALSSVLSSQSSSLRDLDLSDNNLQDSGVKQLSAGLESPHCTLESLRLSGCLITQEGCASLASALRNNPSHLRELDLSYNHPGHSGEKLLSAGLEDPHWRLDTLRLDHGGEQRLKPGVKKYACELELDPNTISRKLKLSDNNRKVKRVEERQSYRDHPDRFDFWPQLLCRNDLTGHCYWEVEWRGTVNISVSYRRISRKGRSDDCRFGSNNQSWSLFCSDGRYSVYHNKRRTSISSSSSFFSSSSVSDRVAVYVDCPAGTLSFYRVSSDTLIHLHTFNTTFTEPLCAGFGVGFEFDLNLLNDSSSVSLCRLDGGRGMDMNQI
ncbi:NLR family CARD domain-containing protein 3-like [Scomber japonicus]|uniref:NLR family CARD domain-containing protein 3-like n=1 Tax=Scomber japonicus TaxID=13676 RepID=UPI002306A05F|nr:NLR family CARD domain-containing protein 3-like [Scomber japonicus]